jgi:hypothetical protein
LESLVTLRERFVTKQTALEALIKDANEALEQANKGGLKDAEEVDREYKKLMVGFGLDA